MAKDRAEEQAIASDDQCAAAIAAIGVIDRELAGIETRKGAAVAAASKAAEEQATPLIGRRAELVARVTAWCIAERRRLTAEGGKTVEFATGKVSWKLGRESVQLPGEKPLQDKILAQLKGARLKRFIKISESISKQALLAATAAERKTLARIRGIVFVPAAESFSIEPTGAELADRPSASQEG